MGKLKWVEIAGSPSKERFELLSRTLAEAGIENEVSYLEANPSNACDVLAEAMKEYDQIRIGPPIGEASIDCVTKSTAQVLSLRSCDAFTKATGQWWPRSYFFDGFLKEFTDKTKGVDINGTVLMVGAGTAARAILGGLIKLGFQRFNITDRFEERGVILAKDLKQIYFTVEFNFVPPGAITTLPGVHTVLVNTTPLTKSNEVLEDLYYFNFFRPGGAVADLTLVPLRPPLLSEAEKVNAQIIAGYEIAGRTDCLWAKDAFNVTLDAKKYKDDLKAALEKVPFDMTPFEVKQD